MKGFLEFKNGLSSGSCFVRAEAITGVTDVYDHNGNFSGCEITTYGGFYRVDNGATGKDILKTVEKFIEADSGKLKDIQTALSEMGIG